MQSIESSDDDNDTAEVNSSKLKIADVNQRSICFLLFADFDDCLGTRTY